MRSSVAPPRWRPTRRGARVQAAADRSRTETIAKMPSASRRTSAFAVLRRPCSPESPASTRIRLDVLQRGQMMVFRRRMAHSGGSSPESAVLVLDGGPPGGDAAPPRRVHLPRGRPRSWARRRTCIALRPGRRGPPAVARSRPQGRPRQIEYTSWAGAGSRIRRARADILLTGCARRSARMKKGRQKGVCMRSRGRPRSRPQGRQCAWPWAPMITGTMALVPTGGATFRPLCSYSKCGL